MNIMPINVLNKSQSASQNFKGANAVFSDHELKRLVLCANEELNHPLSSDIVESNLAKLQKNIDKIMNHFKNDKQTRVVLSLSEDPERINHKIVAQIGKTGDIRIQKRVEGNLREDGSDFAFNILS